MASVSQKLTDLQIRHAINFLRVGNGIERDILKLLTAMEKDIREKIAQRMVNITERGIDIGPKTTERLNLMLDEVRSLIDPVYGQTHGALLSSLEKIAQNEGALQAKALKKALPIAVTTRIPSPARLNSIVTQRPILGKLLEPMVKGMGDATKDRIEAQIRLGMASGEGIEKIVARVSGVEGLEKSKAAIRGLVRTSVNHVSNHAQQETWKENAHLLAGWRFVATLDSRTTLICASHDGEFHPLGEGPIPPLHISCRSVGAPQTKNSRELGLSGKNYTTATRASVDGPVKNQNFDQWLGDQSEARQGEIMGPTRAKLWRDGKLTLQDFIRGDREIIPISDLSSLYPDLFATATEKAATAATAAQVVQQIFSPINKATTAENIKVMKSKDIKKALNDRLEKAAADKRYDPNPEFRGMKAADFGKAALTGGFTDEAASMIAPLMNELDAIADAFALPKLRAIKTTTSNSAIATMGDGVLTMNPTFLNGYSRAVGGVKADASLAAKITAERDAIAAELKILRADIDEIRGIKPGSPDYDEKILVYLDKIDAFNAKRKEWLKLDKKVLLARRTDAAASTTKSAWQVGDAVKARPFNAVSYFEEGIDRARMVLFHEFGHHVHQLWKKAGPRRLAGTPPLEVELNRLFRNLKNYDTLPSSYSKTNSKEWFAESFGLYMMGRFDLVDPEIKALIERLLDEVKSGN